ncbi:hypothetical protein Tco_0909010 [Tanacetum coccineum]|uniref:CCHC-type domain-containing protein n=1 Tax=Tanacetum coccineum TaxID=301880 RepID=A0ABQ5CPV0_9ASTR
MQICLRIFNGGISRLKHHLSRLPSKGVNPCSKVKDDVTEKVRAILASKVNRKEIHIPKKRKQYELKSPIIDTILPNRSLMDLETPIPVTNFFPNVTQSTPSNLSDEENAERSIALFFFENKLDFSVAHFQDSHDDEKDTRSSQEYLNDLEEEYQERALLAKSKRFFKKGSQRFSSAKASDGTICHKCGRKGHFARDYFFKTSVSSYSLHFQKHQTTIFSPSRQKPKLRPNKDFEEKYNKVKAKLALLSSGTSSKSSMVKNKGLIAEAYEWDEEDVSSDDTDITEVKVLMALADNENHINTEIFKENKNLRKELKELTAITETWLNNSNKVNQCISEQIPSQKKRILGLDQLNEDPSSSGQTNLVFVKSSTKDTKVSIPGVERPSFSEAGGFTLLNHDTGIILLAKSQVTIIDASVTITDSSATEYDSADESSVCSTPLPLLEKLAGVEPISGPKTIKSILKPNSTFKPETLKGDTINEPSSTPAKDNKNVSASKRNSTPTGKLMNVNIEDGIPLFVLMKELNSDIRKPICFTKVAFVNGLKYNLVNISQLCDAKYIIQFDEKRGTIFNSKKEVVMIAPRVRDVYVLDMTSSA